MNFYNNQTSILLVSWEDELYKFLKTIYYMCNKGREIYDGRLTNGGIIIMICHAGIATKSKLEV